MAGRVLSRGTWQRLTGSPLEEARLHGLIARFTDSERRAFWAAVLIMDGQTTVSAVVEGYAVLHARPPAPPGPEPEPAPPPPPPPPVMVACEHCGAEAEARLNGSPRRFCSGRCREAHRAAGRTRRAERRARVTAPTSGETDTAGVVG